MNVTKKIIFTIVTGFVISGIPSHSIYSKNHTRILEKSTFEIPLFVLNVKLGKDTFQDLRDGKIYRKVKIGNQVWMAENLNIGKLVLNMQQNDNKQVEKSYYNNDKHLGEKMGGLYTWEEAMDNELPNANKIIQGICPEGWHLPSNKEWNDLCNFLDPSAKANGNGWFGKNIAIALIDSSQNKFNSKFAGSAVSNWFFYLNNMAYYWTSTKYSSASAYYNCLSKDSKQIYRGTGDIKIGMSVRCIKD